ncbi:hypothetical protein COOONC_24989, partial [Cooperia oncophora]
MIESAQPSPRKPRHGVGDVHHSPNVNAERLLNACIDAAMPQPSPSFKSSSKNERGGRECSPVTHCVRPSPLVGGHHANVEDFEEDFDSITPNPVDPNSPSRESSESWSDNEIGSLEKPDITLPLDCFIEEENITIDCSRISVSSHDHSSSRTTDAPSSVQSTPVKTGNRPARTHKTRLPKPTSVVQVNMRKVGRTTAGHTPKKEAKSAVVPPYNYRRP